MPRSTWERMTPELPRAPISAPSETTRATWDTVSCGRESSSASAARMVRDMFVPVSPSGTGKTFSELTMSTCASSQALAERNAS